MPGTMEEFCGEPTVPTAQLAVPFLTTWEEESYSTYTRISSFVRVYNRVVRGLSDDCLLVRLRSHRE